MQQINVTVNNKSGVEPLVQIKSATMSFLSLNPRKQEWGNKFFQISGKHF